MQAQSVAAVRQYLSDHGVSGCEETANVDMLRCQVTVAKAELLLGVQMRAFTHPRIAANLTVRTVHRQC